MLAGLFVGIASIGSLALLVWAAVVTLDLLNLSASGFTFP
ncbi:hypothetical protein IFHNHDMJ_02433 [Synechococcus sp. CBW1107]|nr:hypothetical protein IFHNHDMJ_02433 [Synechococcus sp. CBW1107]